MNSTATPPAAIEIPPRRPRLQFRLGSLMVVMVLCALGGTWWRQWRSHEGYQAANRKLEVMTEQLASLQARTDYLQAVDLLVRKLNLQNAEHRQGLETLQACRGWPHTTLIRRRVAAVPIPSTPAALRRTEVLLFDDPDGGTHHATAVVLHQDRIVDVMSFTTDSVGAPFSATLADSDRDGMIEVILYYQRYQPGASEKSPAYTRSFAATATGFGPSVERLAAGSGAQ